MGRANFYPPPPINQWGPRVPRGASIAGPEACKIAEVIPYFPFKGIPRFYDIGGFLREPEVFQMIVEIFVDRWVCGVVVCGVVFIPKGSSVNGSTHADNT